MTEKPLNLCLYIAVDYFDLFTTKNNMYSRTMIFMSLWNITVIVYHLKWKYVITKSQCEILPPSDVSKHWISQYIHFQCSFSCWWPTTIVNSANCLVYIKVWNRGYISSSDHQNSGVRMSVWHNIADWLSRKNNTIKPIYKRHSW